MSGPKQPLNSCPCSPDTLISVKPMISVLYLFKVKCVSGLPQATDQVLLMVEISSFPLLSPLFSQPRQYSLETKISYISCTFSCMRKKKPKNMGMYSYPVLTIPGCHPAALISAFSSAFWVLLPDLSAPCHGFLERGLPSDSVFSTIIHKKTPQNFSQVKKYIYILTGKKKKKLL